MSSYLVLGASGFLGRHVTDAIAGASRPADLIAVSRRPPKVQTSASQSWISMDLNEVSSADLTALFDATRPDVVVNCVGRVQGTADELRTTNTALVAKVVAALGKWGPTPLVHLGSAAEYGAQPLGIAIRESAVPHPVGIYGRSKLRGTELITEAVARGEIRGTVLRVFNPVGPHSPAGCLAGKAAKLLRLAIHSGRSTIMLGPLGDFRDFVAARDVGEAVLRTIPSIDSQPVLNVGQGVAMSCRVLVELLADAAGFEGDVLEGPASSDQTQPVPWQQADLTLLREQLGWVPTTSIAQALADLWSSET